MITSNVIGARLFEARAKIRSSVLFAAAGFHGGGNFLCEIVHESKPHRRKRFCRFGADRCRYGNIAYFGKILAHGFSRFQTSRKNADTSDIGRIADSAVHRDYLPVGVSHANLSFHAYKIESGYGYRKIAVNGSGSGKQFAYYGTQTVARNAVGAYAQKDRRCEKKAAQFSRHLIGGVEFVNKYFQHG